MTTPSIGLVRAATDRLVVGRLLEEDRDTRAGLAAATGLSKPTVSQSVARLIDAGVVHESGRQSGARGRSGTWCRLRDDVPGALAVHAGPGAVVGEVVDVRGGSLRVVEEPVGRTVDAARLTEALATVSERACDGLPVGPRLVSVADPVDARSGRVVHLEGSPFARGEVDVRAGVGGGDVVVDNDVHWTALAEQALTGLDSFVYAYLGPGIGGALVDGGRLVRGARGLTGELAHLPSATSDGRHGSLLEVLGELGVFAEGTVIDVERAAADRRVVDALALTLRAALTLVAPRALVVGGPWATPDVVAALAGSLGGGPFGVEVRAASVGDARAAVRSAAVEAARDALLARLDA